MPYEMSAPLPDEEGIDTAVWVDDGGFDAEFDEDWDDDDDAGIDDDDPLWDEEPDLEEE